MSEAERERADGDIAARVLETLVRIAGTDAVASDRELALFDSGLLDSLKTVELMLALSDAFGIEISPAEFEREAWATPNRLVADIARRVAAA